MHSCKLYLSIFAFITTVGKYSNAFRQANVLHILCAYGELIPIGARKTLKEDNDIWLVSFIDNGSGFWNKAITLMWPAGENPFAPKVLSVSQESIRIWMSAEGGNRTRTTLTSPRILSPVRLPVPPPRHI